MEFNVIDENSNFKLGNIISVFKLPNYDKEFALFSVSDFDDNEASLHVAYIFKNDDGYDYIDEIEDPDIFKKAMEAASDMIKSVN